MRRSLEKNEKYPNLMPPFKKLGNIEELPEDWKTSLPRSYGSGIYSIYEEINNRKTSIFYGKLEETVDLI